MHGYKIAFTRVDTGEQVHRMTPTFWWRSEAEALAQDIRDARDGGVLDHVAKVYVERVAA